MTGTFITTTSLVSVTENREGRGKFLRFFLSSAESGGAHDAAEDHPAEQRPTKSEDRYTGNFLGNKEQRLSHGTARLFALGGLPQSAIVDQSCRADIRGNQSHGSRFYQLRLLQCLAVSDDRIFDAIMTRLELLEPRKEALRKIARDMRRSPQERVLLTGAALRSQGWMLTGAGIESSGFGALVKTGGLACIYAKVLETWLNDGFERKSLYFVSFRK